MTDVLWMTEVVWCSSKVAVGLWNDGYVVDHRGVAGNITKVLWFSSNVAENHWGVVILKQSCRESLRCCDSHGKLPRIAKVWWFLDKFAANHWVLWFSRKLAANHWGVVILKQSCREILRWCDAQAKSLWVSEMIDMLWITGVLPRITKVLWFSRKVAANHQGVILTQSCREIQRWCDAQAKLLWVSEMMDMLWITKVLRITNVLWFSSKIAAKYWGDVMLKQSCRGSLKWRMCCGSLKCCESLRCCDSRAKFPRITKALWFSRKVSVDHWNDGCVVDDQDVATNHWNDGCVVDDQGVAANHWNDGCVMDDQGVATNHQGAVIHTQSYSWSLKWRMFCGSLRCCDCSCKFALDHWKAGRQVVANHEGDVILKQSCCGSLKWRIYCGSLRWCESLMCCDSQAKLPRITDVLWFPMQSCRESLRCCDSHAELLLVPEMTNVLWITKVWLLM